MIIPELEDPVEELHENWAIFPELKDQVLETRREKIMKLKVQSGSPTPESQ